MSKRGVVLIVCYLVVASLLILSTTFVVRNISGANIARRYVDSTRAFWTTEAGLASGYYNLVNNISQPVGEVGFAGGNYTITVTPVAGYTSRYEITSTGSFGNAQRIVRAVVESSGAGGANPDSIAAAVMTTGGLSITGSAEINPEGSTVTNSTLDFESVFGVSKETLRSIADHQYTDPPENQQPVNGITWVDLNGDTPETATEYEIDSSWNGSGLLIIDGHRNDSTKDITALEISGPWTFNGLIWVIGKLKISGTPVITGGVFAESAVDIDSTIRGNATINFETDNIGDAFNLLDALSQGEVLSWDEI